MYILLSSGSEVLRSGDPFNTRSKSMICDNIDFQMRKEREDETRRTDGKFYQCTTHFIHVHFVVAYPTWRSRGNSLDRVKLG